MRILTITILAAIALANALTVQAQKSGGNRTAEDTHETRYNVDAVKYHAGLGEPGALNQLGAWYYTGRNVPQDQRMAFELWHRAALMQNPKAISNLGVCYQYGTGVEPDSLTAMQLYVIAIQNGHNDLLAQRSANTATSAFDAMLVGLCNEKGIGVDADAQAAAKAYKQAVRLGSVDALVPLVRLSLAVGDNTAALDYARRAADAGIAEGQYLTGSMLASNHIGGNTEGIRYLNQAADNGSLPAANLLAHLLMNNSLPDCDKARLASQLHAGAQAGDTESMLDYAIFLKDGIGTARDYESAMYWLARALDAGNNTMNTDPVIKRQFSAHDPFSKYAGARVALADGDIHRAASLAKDLAKAKAPEAKVIEALILADPANPKGNVKKAVKLLEKAASSNVHAAYLLAGMYEKGNGVVADQHRANNLLKRAADQGYAPALSRMGDIYYDGIALPMDTRAATDCYARAYADRRITAFGAANYERLGGVIVPGYEEFDMIAPLKSLDIIR